MRHNGGNKKRKHKEMKEMSVENTKKERINEILRRIENKDFLEKYKARLHEILNDKGGKKFKTKSNSTSKKSRPVTGIKKNK